MKAQKVIKRSNLPKSIPLFPTLLIILALDFYNAPGWLWGVICCLLAIINLASIIAILNEKGTDIFKEIDSK